MAIYHLHVSTHVRGSGAARAASVLRLGRHRARGDLVIRDSANLPAWASAWPLAFWEAADAFERANGRACTEIEFALPRELTDPQRIALTRAFVADTLGNRHPVSWAIHTSRAADGGEQPHAHILFSERVVDGIERAAERFFRRGNSRDPHNGGAGKDRALSRRGFVAELRARWAHLANDHLARAAVPARIDHRSYRARVQQGARHLAQLEPQVRRGTGVHLEARGRSSHRVAAVRAQMARNGERIVADPAIALEALDAQHSPPTRREIERFLVAHTDGVEQFRRARLAVLALAGIPLAGDDADGGAGVAVAPPASVAPLPVDANGLWRAWRSVKEAETEALALQRAPHLARRAGGADRATPIARPVPRSPIADRRSVPGSPLPSTARRAWGAPAPAPRPAAGAGGDRLRALCDRARARARRRYDALNAQRRSAPRRPVGLLAPFRRRAYDAELAQWQRRCEQADRLVAQANRLVTVLAALSVARMPWPGAGVVADPRARSVPRAGNATPAATPRSGSTRWPPAARG